MIDLTVHPDRLERAVQRARERNIVIPTYKQMKNPALIPDRIKADLRGHRPVGRQPGQPVPHHVEERAGAAAAAGSAASTTSSSRRR